MLLDIQDIINPVLDINEDIIYIKKIEESRIIRGEVNIYSDKVDSFDALFKFYRYINKQYPGICFYYPVWAILSPERIQRKDWKRPDRFYIYNDIGNYIRPKALYAVGYARCWYGNGGSLYEKMLQYIDNNELEICGDAYEEYPLNELCHVNEDEYLMRVLIPVRKRK